MEKREIHDECIICGKIEINNFWYRPGRTPPHETCYHGAVCPDCKNKKMPDTKQTTYSSSLLKVDNLP